MVKLTWHHVGEQEIDPMEIKLVEERLYYRLNPFGVAKNLRHKKVSEEKSFKKCFWVWSGEIT